jgi:hypothetical protein
MATFNKNKNFNYRNATPYDNEYDLDLTNEEVYELVKEEIENGMDEIPETLTITALQPTSYNEKYDEWEEEEMDFEINPFEYLNEEQLKELEQLIETEY